MLGKTKKKAEAMSKVSKMSKKCYVWAMNIEAAKWKLGIQWSNKIPEHQRYSSDTHFE